MVTSSSTSRRAIATDVITNQGDKLPPDCEAFVRQRTDLFPHRLGFIWD